MKIRCKLCNTVIEGDKKGSCIDCKCGKCYIDETPHYVRIGGNPSDIEILDSNDKGELLSDKINKEVEKEENK